MFPYRDFPSCLSDCESAQYGLASNADARTPCVEACLRGLCGRDDACFYDLRPLFVGWIEGYHASAYTDAMDRCVDEYGCQPSNRIDCLDAAGSQFLLVHGAARQAEIDDAIAAAAAGGDDPWDETWRPWNCGNA
ncbi:MAG: hypothetical protein FJ102_23740 [Deltaproteobacteria bacterium]|nr:hypothetical protein [Deltaproteobacteria bacterium]